MMTDEQKQQRRIKRDGLLRALFLWAAQPENIIPQWANGTDAELDANSRIVDELSFLFVGRGEHDAARRVMFDIFDEGLWFYKYEGYLPYVEFIKTQGDLKTPEQLLELLEWVKG